MIRFQLGMLWDANYINHLAELAIFAARPETSIKLNRSRRCIEEIDPSGLALKLLRREPHLLANR